MASFLQSIVAILYFEQRGRNIFSRILFIAECPKLSAILFSSVVLSWKADWGQKSTWSAPFFMQYLWLLLMPGDRVKHLQEIASWALNPV